MRINGFEQMKAFYSWVFDNADKQVKPQHISLYIFLLNQNNRANWVEWFKCPFDLAMQGACIGNKKTYYNCLRDLNEWRLIEYKKGINEWKAPLIKIEVLKCTTAVPQSEPQGVPQGVPQGTQSNKPITGNLKPVTSDVDKFVSTINNTLKRNYKVTDKLRPKIRKILTEYELQEIEKAATNAKADKFHAESNCKYLTAEFFTRSDKVEMWLNASSGEQKPKGKFRNPTTLTPDGKS